MKFFVYKFLTCSMGHLIPFIFFVNKRKEKPQIQTTKFWPWKACVCLGKIQPMLKVELYLPLDQRPRLGKLYLCLICRVFQLWKKEYCCIQKDKWSSLLSWLWKRTLLHSNQITYKIIAIGQRSSVMTCGCWSLVSNAILIQQERFWGWRYSSCIVKLDANQMALEKWHCRKIWEMDSCSLL